MNKTGDGVYYLADDLVRVSVDDILFLKGAVRNTEKKRVRLCVHKNEADDLHEMIIVLANDTYIRPAKHLTRAESMHVIEGEADAVFFDENGCIVNIISLSSYSDMVAFYYRLNTALYHTLVVKSKYFIFHECTRGPFNPSDTILADWSPDDSNKTEVSMYMQYLRNEVKLNNNRV